MSDQQLAELMSQLLSGVAYLHSQKIIHRDIKPANLLLTEPSKLAIADFDVATQVVRLRTQHRSCVGTPWYTAPEVIMVEPYSTAADVWSIGCCALHLGTGCRPYSECNHVQAAYKMVNEPNPGFPSSHTLSPEAMDFMQQCWRRDPRLRPSAAELQHHPLLAKYGLCPNENGVVPATKVPAAAPRGTPQSGVDHTSSVSTPAVAQGEAIDAATVSNNGDAPTHDDDVTSAPAKQELHATVAAASDSSEGDVRVAGKPDVAPSSEGQVEKGGHSDNND